MTSQQIQPDLAALMGKPVVGGTRITGEQILDEQGAGGTIEELVEAHPRLTRDGALAVLRFGAEAMRAGVIYPSASPRGGL